jgi:tRNA A37 threonylcarbamoyladenosine dehydratase
MWEYLGRRDPTRLSVDELKEAKVDDKVHALTSLLKKHDVPKVFGTEPFSKAHPRTEVLSLSKLFDLL